jgi:hypothetical protein
MAMDSLMDHAQPADALCEGCGHPGAEHDNDVRIVDTASGYGDGCYVRDCPCDLFCVPFDLWDEYHS